MDVLMIKLILILSQFQELMEIRQAFMEVLMRTV